MKRLFQPILAIIAVLLSGSPVLAQVSPVTIYGHQYTQSGEMVLTIMKPDGLRINEMQISSGLKIFTVKMLKWVRPAIDSESEECVITIDIKQLYFDIPVVLTLLNRQGVVGMQKLDTRSAYGKDYLDFYSEL